eukprot:TRINITY_DN6749_c0_g1_i1.p1 TRINITY_DN6749_c0_g1~~TRINITY_DN6749_c0_g1_i1.p1  ORF type:complete len:405 (-),score=88.18 TRINITY_DN6749_c0_g1_i1:312-1526(-)
MFNLEKSSEDPDGSDPEKQSGSVPNVNDFLVLKTLGTGTFGSVFLAREKKFKHFFAVKVIRRTKENTKAILMERNILTRINSPSVAKLFITFQTEVYAYFVMEFLPGASLKDIIQNTAPLGLPEAEVRKYFSQLLLAVKFLHERGISHRDLKTENIMMCDDGRLKLIDFGCSTFRETTIHQQELTGFSCPEDLNLNRTVVGTPLYCPPEIILCACKGYDSKMADMWSLGIILFELLTGRRPFSTSSFSALQRYLKIYIAHADTYDFPWELPDQEVRCKVTPLAQDLVQKLLRPEPQQRLKPHEAQKHKFFEEVGWEELEEWLISFNNKQMRSQNELSSSAQAQIKESELREVQLEEKAPRVGVKKTPTPPVSAPYANFEFFATEEYFRLFEARNQPFNLEGALS